MCERLTWHEPQRQATLASRGLDFADAHEIFANATFEFEDVREDYGEKRMICFGYLSERLTAVGYVQHGESRHIFSMRKANEREKAKFGQ